MYSYGDEEGDLDSMLHDGILMATQAVQHLEEDETMPPTPFGPTPLSPHRPAEVEFVPTAPSEVGSGRNFGTPMTGRIDIDAYDLRPFSGDDGDHAEFFLDELVERLQKMPDVGALPTYVYVPKSLTRRYARQANLILKWWVKECDRRQPNSRYYEVANLFLWCFDFSLSRGNLGLEETHGND